jgi:fatty acid-binding protein DegV
MKNKEGTKLDLYKTVRTMRKAVKVMAEGLKEQNAKGEWTFYISHAGNPIAADLAKETIKSLFADAKVEIFDLCSAFVAHGGPGCVAMQAVNENIA